IRRTALAHNCSNSDDDNINNFPLLYLAPVSPGARKSSLLTTIESHKTPEIKFTTSLPNIRVSLLRGKQPS
ncbi:MAG TPA: hypothetical protein VEV19_16085, partial [Ktedonobacteraceae bacterium]|nr:hypothetical protein [Ktedonobacteraceae bacterium]